MIIKIKCKIKCKIQLSYLINKDVKIPANQLGCKCALAEGEVLKISAHKTYRGLWDCARNWTTCYVRCRCTQFHT